MGNEREKQLSRFFDDFPQFRGKFVGWTKEDGLGISRIDDRWYRSTFYLITSDDLIPILRELFADKERSELVKQEE